MAQCGLTKVIHEPAHILKSWIPGIFSNFNQKFYYPPPYKHLIWKYEKSNTDLTKRLVRDFDWGLFNNYVTLKLPLFWSLHPHHHASLRMITRPSCVTSRLTQISPLYHFFLFFEVEKKQRYAPTHYTSTHIFKQLNQIVRFK